MGKIDILTKNYTNNPEVCADIFNKYLYHGKAVIRPENLQPLDTAMLAEPFDSDGKIRAVQKFRDTLKLATLMTDGRTFYCVVGVENQADVHYAMPVRNGLYDFLQLSDQVKRIGRRHKRNRKESRAEEHRATGDEYLSKYWKTDRLIPVITVVVYWNSEKWDGMLNLHEMYDTDDEAILKYAPGYHVNLIEPCSMTNQEIEEFHTDMREVMQFIKYSCDKEKLSEMMQKNNRFRKMKRQVAELINEVTNSKLKIPEEEVEVDMCQAILDMRKESESIGEMRGKAEGIAEGKAEGIISMYKEIYGSQKGLSDYLLSHCDLDYEQAKKYIRKYW